MHTRVTCLLDVHVQNAALQIVMHLRYEGVTTLQQALSGLKMYASDMWVCFSKPAATP